MISSSPAGSAGSAGSTGWKAAAIILLLLGIGGFALPLIAPLIGVLIMLSMPRWTHLQVRVTSLIAGVGVLATVALVALAVGGSTSATAIRWSLLLISIVVLVGPGAALHTATRRQ